MVSGYQIMLTTVSVEILCTLWSYNLHKICKLPSCLLQDTHSNTQSKLSVLVRLFFLFLYLLPAGGQAFHPRIGEDSLCKLLLLFTYSVVHFHLTGCQRPTPAWESSIYWKISIENYILFQNREKMNSFVLVEQNFPLIPLMSHTLAEGLDFTQ